MRVALGRAVGAARLYEVPVGAVVVREGRCIAEAGNLQRRAADPTAHAELRALRIAAMRSGSERLPGSTLYVTMEPCIMCVGAALLARVERIVFGCWDPKGGALGGLLDLRQVSGLNHRLEVRGGVCETESREVLQSFFAQRRGGGPQLG